MTGAVGPFSPPACCQTSAPVPASTATKVVDETPMPVNRRPLAKAGVEMDSLESWRTHPSLPSVVLKLATPPAGLGSVTRTARLASMVVSAWAGLAVVNPATADRMHIPIAKRMFFIQTPPERDRSRYIITTSDQKECQMP